MKRVLALISLISLFLAVIPVSVFSQTPPNATPEITAYTMVISTVLNPGVLSSDADYDYPDTIIGTQADLTPNASSTLQAYVHILVRDEDGWEDIEPAGEGVLYAGHLSSNGLPECTTTNGYDCYADVVTTSACTLVAHADYVVQLRCPVTLTYYAKADTNWNLHVEIFDRLGASADQTTLFTVNSVLAYSLSPTEVDFGSVSVPFFGIANANKEIHIANAGNTDIAQLQVDHTPMACVAGSVSTGSVPASDMAYSTSPISSLGDSYTVGAVIGEDFDFPVPAQTDETIQVATLYNHLVNVPNGVVGMCSGTITFTPSS